MRCAPQTVAVLVAQEAELAKPSTSQEQTSVVIIPAPRHHAVLQIPTVLREHIIPAKPAQQLRHTLPANQKLPLLPVLFVVTVQVVLIPAMQLHAGLPTVMDARMSALDREQEQETA